MGKFRVRDKQVKFRCTEAEKMEIERLASENHMSINTYLRKMALEGHIVNVDFSELKNLVYEVNRIGNNVNQIAYHVNRDNMVYKSDIDDVKSQINMIWTLLRAELFSLK